MSASLPTPPTAAAVIVAAGASSRMNEVGPGASGSAAGEASSNGRVRKPFLMLAGKTVLEHVCAAFALAEHVTEIVIVAHPDDVQRVQRMCADSPALDLVRVVVPGGAERADSVRAGVRWTAFSSDVILIHDAARPLIEPDCIERAIEVAAREGAALVAAPVTDTIKLCSRDQKALETLDRSRLWSAQTPQAFQARSLRELLARAEKEGFRPTDDAAIYEAYVGPVPIVRGSPHNLKLTTGTDLLFAEAVLRSRRNGHPSP